MRRAIIAVVLLAAGCFRPPLSGSDLPDARAVVERFRETAPVSFQLLSSVVFEYNWISFAGVGLVRIDTGERSYKVACVNHMGVKLFELEGNRTGVRHEYVIQPLADRGNVAAAVGSDIERIYFDLVPSPDARIIRRKREIRFRQRSGSGVLEHVFDFSGRLLRKSFREDHRRVWRVVYREYELKDGKIYPSVITLRNYRHGYRLTVRQKEIRN